MNTFTRLISLVCATMTLPAVAQAMDQKIIDRAQSNAGKAMRVVVYGLDNELPDRKDVHMAQFLANAAQGCINDIATVRAADPQFVFELNGQAPMSIDLVEEKFCRPALALLQPVLGSAVAGENALYEGLSAARRDVMATYGLSSYTIYGPGKQVLKSPQELQNANVWIVWDHESKTLTPQWWMTTIRWTGDRYEKSSDGGPGFEPALSKFAP